MKKKILVVDDSSLARRLARRILEELGFEVEEAPGGAEALELFALNHYDLVILDMLMAGMYGLEVLYKLKELNSALPVIIVSADIQRSTREQVKAGGASGMVNKPLNKEELAEMLDIVWKGGMSWN
jgi:two-component system chemotaxis response regulator CheY